MSEEQECGWSIFQNVGETTEGVKAAPRGSPVQGRECGFHCKLNRKPVKVVWFFKNVFIWCFKFIRSCKNNTINLYSNSIC